MYEYFMHGTQSFKEIIESGNLDAAFTDKETYDIPKGVYCQYIWDGLPIVYPDMHWAYGLYVFVIDLSIAKRNEMYICDSVQYGACVNVPERRIFHSKGKLKQIPDFTPLRKKIIEDCMKT